MTRRISDHPDRRIEAENAAELLIEVAERFVEGRVNLELLRKATEKASDAFHALHAYEIIHTDAALDRRGPRRGLAACERELNDEDGAMPPAPDTAASRPMAGSVHGAAGDPLTADAFGVHETHGAGRSLGGAR